LLLGTSDPPGRFFDVPDADKWDRSQDQCDSDRLKDFTGVVSLCAPLFARLCFLVVHNGEKASGGSWRFVPEWMVTPVPFDPETDGYDDSVHGKDVSEGDTKEIKTLDVVEATLPEAAADEEP